MGWRINPTNVRAILGRVNDILDARPELAGRYENAKRIVRAFRRPAFYEITQRCNLKCEGCYYFEGGLTDPVPEEDSIAAWEEFFAAEARRKVTVAYLVGAEPALEQERLAAAATYLPHANVGTNGTIRIDPSIRCRISVSVWAGDDATDRKMRGSSAFRKAFKNYAGDPRAIILYTLSPWNLDGVREIARMCRDHDLSLTFNMYSPTSSFLGKLRAWSGNDDMFFRSSSPGHTPCFANDELLHARNAIADLMDDFPETIVYSKAYNTWATEPGPRFDLDPDNGMAIDCGSRIIGNLRYYSSDLRQQQPKCCTPAIDCSQCRMYSSGWSSRFQPNDEDLADERTLSSWIDMMETVGKIFLYQHGGAHVGTSEQPHSLVAAE